MKKRRGVMLAYPTSEGLVNRLGDSFFAQPKFNGERCVVEWFGGEPYFISAFGNTYWVPHLQNQMLQLAKTLGFQPAFDGELYTHGWPRERIRSAVSCKVNKSGDIEGVGYHIFDLREENPQLQRIFRLLVAKQHVNQLLSTEPDWQLFVAETVLTNSTDWVRLCREFVDSGYEGIILRHAEGVYKPKRNVQMLKYKPTEYDDYQVVDIEEAYTKENTPKGMVGAFVVADQDGRQFKVSAGQLTFAERREIWQKKDKLLASQPLLLLVKHEAIKTANGIPLCAVASKLHTKKDRWHHDFD